MEGSATLVYELTLVKFEKAKESWQVNFGFCFSNTETTSRSYYHAAGCRAKARAGTHFQGEGHKALQGLVSFPVMLMLIIFALQDQKYEIASSRYQKVS